MTKMTDVNEIETRTIEGGGRETGAVIEIRFLSFATWAPPGHELRDAYVGPSSAHG